jgi:N-methylhydantoinase B
VTGFVAIDHTVVLREIGPCQPGDVIITNDPYSTGGAATHLPDIQVYKPIFHNGELVCFAWSFCHASDVGGMAPASISPGASEIYQEGLRIPPYRLYRAGELDEAFVGLMKANCRIPEQNWGDIKAMVAALNTAERRIAEMIAKFGEQRVRRGMNDLLGYAARRAGDIIEAIPDGEYEFVDYLDDDVISAVPIRMRLTLRVRGRELEMDFSGTDPQVNSAFNLPTGGRLHPFLCVGLVAFFMTTDPFIALNGGLVRPVRMVLPPGSLVNPSFPAACGVRYATAIRAIDLVFGALIQALPDRIPAAGGGQGCMVVCSLLNPDTGRREIQVVQPIQGGAGAMLNKDGMGGTYYCAGLRNTPIESIETHLPIIVRRYHQVVDSGGPGRRRGGPALRLDFQVFSPGGIVTARGMERYRFQPWGAAGGLPGASGRTMLNPGADRERDIGKINILHLEAGDVVSTWSPAGGGYGSPDEREPELVLRDVLDEVVSLEAAREIYRVVIRNGQLDAAATEALRAERRAERNGPFHFGPARERHDTVWRPEVVDSVNALIMQLAPAIRPFAKAELHRRVAAMARERPVGPDDITTQWEVVTRVMRGEVAPAAAV